MRLGLLIAGLAVVGCGGSQQPDTDPITVPSAGRAGSGASAGAEQQGTGGSGDAANEDGGAADPGSGGMGGEPSAGAPTSGDGGRASSGGMGGAPTQHAGAGGRAAGGMSGGSTVAGTSSLGGMGGHQAGAGGAPGGGAGAGAGMGGAAAGSAGVDPGTRSLLGCGKSSSGYPCSDGSYLWLCPDAAKPVGSYTVPGPTTRTLSCSAAASSASEWCCNLNSIQDTRLTPSDVCGPQQLPFQSNTRADGDFTCLGVI